MRTLAFLLAALATTVAAAGTNIDPGNDGSRYAWSENLGWINAKPLGDGGPGLEVRDFAVTGYAWSENAGWISFSCENTGSCAAARWGVTNDGHGHLAGYAWAENAGWIDIGALFAGVSIDPATGEFAGHAWGENVGWIAFAADGAAPFRLRTAWRCFPVPVPPAGAIALFLDRAGESIGLEWNAVPGASAYDVQRGSLLRLAASGGDFAVATEACESRKQPGTALVTSSDSTPGAGSWYVVRAANCGGAGSFDDDGPGLARSRDPGIAASPEHCP